MDRRKPQPFYAAEGDTDASILEGMRRELAEWDTYAEHTDPEPDDLARIRTLRAYTGTRTPTTPTTAPFYPEDEGAVIRADSARISTPLSLVTIRTLPDPPPPPFMIRGTLGRVLHNVIAHPLLVLWPPVGAWLHDRTDPEVDRP